MNQQKNLEILIELRKNAREQLTKISKKTKIPVSTIHDKIRSNNNIIIKHVSILDFEKLGFTGRATICIKCHKKSKENFYNMIKKHQNINNLYKINNGFDYMFEVIFKNFKDLEDFIEKIEDEYSIKTKQVYYIIAELIKEKFLSDQLHIPITTY
ncbi:MAG: Lrp/AsnC family transcriptional regulator [Candidatus Woesearchaeota archaeon]